MLLDEPDPPHAYAPLGSDALGLLVAPQSASPPHDAVLLELDLALDHSAHLQRLPEEPDLGVSPNAAAPSHWIWLTRALAAAAYRGPSDPAKAVNVCPLLLVDPAPYSQPDFLLPHTSQSFALPPEEPRDCYPTHDLAFAYTRHRSFGDYPSISHCELAQNSRFLRVQRCFASPSRALPRDCVENSHQPPSSSRCRAPLQLDPSAL